MKKTITLIALVGLGLGPCSLFAQSPLFTSWKITGKTITKGSTTIITDVEAVYYDSSSAYIKTSGIPDDYDFATSGNVNEAYDLKAVFKITRSPQKNTGKLTSALGGGQYGLYKDGTEIFNGEDAMSYNNQNVWHSLAYYFEGKDFDASWGHSTPTNQYHHHVLDLDLQDTTKSMVHSPILGFAFDGFPIYGPFACKDPNDLKSSIVRMTPSYQKRNITDRTTLGNGTTLTGAQTGPAIGGKYPLGCYREDYIYVANSGLLDDHNGRFCKTPEYPNGTYAYFAILDSNLKPQYPYVFGQSMYGITDASNMGPGGGKATIPAGAVKYGSTGIETVRGAMPLQFYPNPATGTVQLAFPSDQRLNIEVTDMTGRVLIHTTTNTNQSSLDISGLAKGMYIIHADGTAGSSQWTGRLVKE